MRGITVRRSGAVAWAALCLAVAASAGDEQPPEPARSVPQALARGDYRVGLRYRWEHVDDDNPAFASRGATASTLRTALLYRSGTFRDFGIRFEVENVTDVGKARAHDNRGSGDLANGIANRPAIPDPSLTEVLQASLRYGGLPHTMLALGREEINLGEERFVGSVGWRQHRQSFDAIRVETSAIPRVELSYAFLDRQENVFGGSIPMDTHALMAAIELGRPGTLTLYGLDLDYERPAQSGLSTTTLGARFKGSFAAGARWTVPYHVEYAEQSDSGSNPASVDAGYVRLEVGGRRGALWLRAGYELLEGSTGDGAFSTPLATLHKWNGWADKFLSTPATGLEDLSIAAGNTWGNWSGTLVCHVFAADSGGADYGREIDALLSWTAGWGQVFAASAGFYDADEFSDDTEKIWLYTTYRFGS